MPTIIEKEKILGIVETLDVVSLMEKAFIQYSKGNTVVPPIGELLFDEPKGEAHIKYGYIKNDDVFCIKIASGFYDNVKLGIPSSQGLMLLFSQQTGEPLAVLLDEGQLTDIRTAAAGALAANYFAPKDIQAIGIIGTGTQARLQLAYAQQQRPCNMVWVWGRHLEHTIQFQAELSNQYHVQIAKSPAELASQCNHIITTTPANSPLLLAKDIKLGTHITAVGSDTVHKQELESGLLGRADLVISDSIPQSKSRGEVYKAVQEGKLNPDVVIELGVALQDPSLCRTNNKQITIVDLTGVAVQDIAISKAVYKAYIDNQA